MMVMAASSGANVQRIDLRHLALLDALSAIGIFSMIVMKETLRASGAHRIVSDGSLSVHHGRRPRHLLLS